MSINHEPTPDVRDLFSREELLAAWRLTVSSILTELEISEIVDDYLKDRAWVISGDLMGALAIQSDSALERARAIWGHSADLSAARVRGLIQTVASSRDEPLAKGQA